jgi:prepilin-type N-terminal cleavage/methylation domain-containing protein
MKIKKMKGKAGFTLIELMIVVIIIGILAASAVPIYRANVRKAYAAEGFATLGAIRSAERLYKAEWNAYKAVTAGANATTGGIYKDLGLDTADNQYWNNPAFAVTAGGTGTAAVFKATATGSHSTAPGKAKISDITLTMDQTGVTTGP